MWEVQKRYREEELKLKDIMDTNIKTLHLEETTEKAFQLVSESQYGFIPVIDQHSKIIGIVNRAGLVEYIADQIGE